MKLNRVYIIRANGDDVVVVNSLIEADAYIAFLEDKGYILVKLDSNKHSTIYYFES